MREVSDSGHPDWFNMVVLILVVLAVIFVVLQVFDTIALALA